VVWDSNPNAAGEGEARQSQTHSKLAGNKKHNDADYPANASPETGSVPAGHGIGFYLALAYSVNAVTVAVDPGVMQIEPLIDMNQPFLDANNNIDRFRQLVQFLFDPG
jgi:hypothetical protein